MSGGSLPALITNRPFFATESFCSTSRASGASGRKEKNNRAAEEISIIAEKSELCDLSGAEKPDS
jgi:hypothetical protein